MQDKVEVTEADRKAANGILYCAVPGSFTAEGQFKLDMDAVAQAFASHRLAALQPKEPEHGRTSQPHTMDAKSSANRGKSIPNNEI